MLKSIRRPWKTYPTGKDSQNFGRRTDVANVCRQISTCQQWHLACVEKKMADVHALKRRAGALNDGAYARSDVAELFVFTPLFFVPVNNSLLHKERCCHTSRYIKADRRLM